MWAFNYFFYNKKLKRMLYLACRAVPKGADDSEARGAAALAAPLLRCAAALRAQRARACSPAPPLTPLSHHSANPQAASEEESDGYGAYNSDDDDEEAAPTPPKRKPSGAVDYGMANEMDM